MTQKYTKLRFRLSGLLLLFTLACVFFAGVAMWMNQPTLVPKHSGYLAILTTKKGQPGGKCGGNLGLNGNFSCGPKKSLTNLKYNFVEHRRDKDYYKFVWTLTNEGKPITTKTVTIGYDGQTETTVIDAQHYIVIRKENTL